MHLRCKAGRVQTQTLNAVLVAGIFCGSVSAARAQSASTAPGAPGSQTTANQSAGNGYSAADGGASLNQLQAVVVTALRRNTLAQRTPIALSVVTGNTLANAGLQDVTGLTSQVPGLTFISGGPTDDRIVIRGIWSAGEPMVGLYYDETAVTGAIGSGADAAGSTPLSKLYDVSRIEVLRGPQGTLFGSGTMGGALRVIFNKPTFNYEGEIDTQGMAADGGDTGYDVEGMVNVPLIDDKLAARAVVYGGQSPGYIDNVELESRPENLNDGHDQGARVQLRFLPTDQLTIDGLFLYQDDNGQSPTWYPAAGQYKSLAITQLPYDDETLLYNVTATWDLGGVVATAIASDVTNDVTSTGDINLFYSDLNKPGTCQALYNGGTPCSGAEFAAYNSTVSYDERNALMPIQHVENPSAELRLSSEGEHWGDWTVGAFVSHRYTQVNNSDYVGNGDTGALDLSSPIYTRLIYDNLDQYALYGQADVHLTHRLTLTVGARYFDYVRTESGQTPLGLFLVGASATGFEAAGASQDGYVPKYGLSYQATQNVLLYTSASKGFRPGGANQVVGLPSALTPYKSDELWDYELGEKSTWFQDKLRFNADVFLIDWTDMQVSGLTPNGAFSFISNAGAAQAKGLEMDLAMLPLRGLTIDANATLESAKLTENQVNANVEAPGKAGDRFPYTPRFSAGLSVQYERPMTSAFNGLVRVDDNYAGSSYTQFEIDNIYTRVIPSYNMANFRIGIEAPDVKWGVYAYVDNLFNRVVILSSSASALSLDQTSVTSMPPRVYGLELRERF